MTPAERGKFGVLIVDDEAMNVHYPIERLTQQGFKVAHAKDMYDVPTAVKKLGVPVKVIIADFNTLPEQREASTYLGMSRMLDDIDPNLTRRNGIAFAEAIQDGKFKDIFPKNPYYVMYSNMDCSHDAIEKIGIDKIISKESFGAHTVTQLAEDGARAYDLRNGLAH